MQATNTWIRVAGSKERIMRGDPKSWRCYADPNLTEYPVTHCVFSGNLSSRNCFMEINKDGDERGLFAWIRYFGSIVIENDVARIEIAEPPRE